MATAVEIVNSSAHPVRKIGEIRLSGGDWHEVGPVIVIEAGERHVHEVDTDVRCVIEAAR